MYRWFTLHTANWQGTDKSRNDKVLAQMKEILEDPQKESYIKQQEKQTEYERQLREQVLQPVLGERLCLRDIYVSLHGKRGKRNTPQKEKKTIVDITSYIWDWFQRQDSSLLFLYGEPGKSSIVKMAAATIVASVEMEGTVVFIDLHRLAFSDKESALEVVEAYIQHNFPWLFDEECCEKRLMNMERIR